MPEWVSVPLDFEPAPAGTNDVFVRSAEPFSADLGKTTTASNQPRQRFFEDQLRRIAWHLGEDTIPVFLDFNGDKRRMDKGCVGHAVASGLLERPISGPQGYVTHIRLKGARERPRPATQAQLWHSYSREDIPGLFGHAYSSGAWNQGFVVQGQDVFLLVTLDKSGHHQDHHYQDRFLSRNLFQWESQNRTTQASTHGQIIKQALPEYNIHLLVRRRKLEDGLGAPFTYCGQVDFQRWEGEKPITVEWGLRSELAKELALAWGVE